MCNERIIATHMLELYWPLTKLLSDMCWKGSGSKSRASSVYERLLTNSNLMGKTPTFLYSLSLTGRRPRKFLEISHGRPLSKPYLQFQITFPSQSKL